MIMKLLFSQWPRTCSRLPASAGFMLVVLFFGYAAAAQEQRAQSIEDLLSRLRTMERATLRNIEYELRETYTLSRKPETQDELLETATSYAVVWQGNMYRQQMFQTSKWPDNRETSFETKVTFDGEQGYSLNGGAGNLTRYKIEPQDLQSIHASLLRQTGFGEALSDCLGAPAKESIAEQEVVFLGESSKDGLPCYGVRLLQRVELGKSAQSQFVTSEYFFETESLWPVEFKRYRGQSKGDKGRLARDFVVTEWQTVEGKKFPAKTRHTSYGPGGSIEYARTQELEILGFSPRHPRDYFQIVWPQGTIVYEKSSPEKVTLRYKVGEGADSQAIADSAKENESSAEQSHPVESGGESSSNDEGAPNAVAGVAVQSKPHSYRGWLLVAAIGIVAATLLVPAIFARMRRRA